MKKLSYIAVLTGLMIAAVTAHAGKDGWMTNYDEALAKAKAEGKHVLVEFHGSDWCPPCIKLNKEVLTQDAFKSFASSSLVLVDADFPRKSKLPAEQMDHNNELAKKFEVRYFPTIVVLDSDGNVLDKMVGFPQGGLEGLVQFISDKTDS
jgi:thiol-disulfide isomerase/thioredoxin